jgi:hypothetical protein
MANLLLSEEETSVSFLYAATVRAHAASNAIAALLHADLAMSYD